MSIWIFILIAVIAFVIVFGIIVFVRNFLSRNKVEKISRGTGMVLDRTSVTGEKRRRIGGEVSGRANNHLREKVFGFVVAGLFATLMVRLWTLQVFMSGGFKDKAKENMSSTVTLAAKRGRILDRNGNVLVDNRPSLCVQGTMDVADDKNVVHRLSIVLGLPTGIIRNRLLDGSLASQALRTIAYDVPLRSVAYIQEHPTAFEGVTVASKTVRSYPYGSLAAHVLGYTGTISESELQEAKISGNIDYQSDDIVGKTGAEAAYEAVLQGERGEKVYQVDANGTATDLLSTTDAFPGSDVKLTLDLNLQAVAESSLVGGLKYSHDAHGYKCTAGSVVLIDLEDGGILASASYPTFNPADFIGGVSEELWASMTSEKSQYPLTNRVIAGQYPAASTFKTFSGLAGLQHKIITNKTVVNCGGEWDGFGESYIQHCWELSGHGDVDFNMAYKVSCDIYFYEEAKGFYENTKEEDEVLQNEYKSFGFDSLTGVDLPGEQSGRIPTPEWKAAYYEDMPSNAAWVPGDYSNMIIGQGDILVTPLQLAMAYGAVATGQLIKPHYLKEVINEKGEPTVSRVLEAQETQPVIDKKNYGYVREALHETAVNYGFSSLPVSVAAKTGTGETGIEGKDDYAVFVTYAPIEKPKYCCACIVEQGGSGAMTAMPVARDILFALYGTETDESIGAYANRDER